METTYNTNNNNPDINNTNDTYLQDYWYINNKIYNFKKFIKLHPGGELMLKLGQGRDCTILFNTYHPYIEKPLKILEKYYIKDVLPNSTNYISNKKDPMYEELRDMIQKYEKSNGSLKIKEYSFILCIIFLILFWISYYLTSYGHYSAAILCGIFHMLSALQLSHDGLHGAVSLNPTINFIAGCSSLPFIYSPIPWLIQHDVQHHVYTNEVHDIDLYFLTPYLRVSPLFPKNKYSFLNIFWVLVECVFATLNLSVFIPIEAALNLSKLYPQAKNKHLIIDPNYSSLICHISFTLFCWSYIIYCQGFLFSLIPWMTTGFYFIIITQVSHLQCECHDIDESQPFSIQQVNRSIDYCGGSYFWNFVTGGLNTQTLHHLFPSVHGSRHPDLYPEYLRICKKYDVNVINYASFSKALCNYIEWIKLLSFK